MRLFTTAAILRAFNSSRTLATTAATNARCVDTALHQAVKTGDEEGVKSALTNGANANYRDENGLSAVDHVRFAELNRKPLGQIGEWLRNSGGQPTIQGDEGIREILGLKH